MRNATNQKPNKTPGPPGPTKYRHTMEIIRSQKGKNKGKISVARTLATLRKREKWEADAAELNIGYIRECASKLSKTMGREFSVSHTAEMGDKIVIIRTA